MSEINFHPASPILRVSNLDASLKYYTERLEFKIDWNHEGYFASVSRGHANLMLSENDQSAFGTWVYIGVGDVRRLHTEFENAGAIIKLPPRNFPWGMEIHVADPDGNVIRFGSEQDDSIEFDEWVMWYEWGRES